ncbi:MAG: hypothetical protein IT345_11935 [Trueperaceae bacterium]|nr:hypothetical protein [Trueperaceae bacterium]
MATFNLRRFSRPEALKAIKPEHLLELLSPYRDFLSARGVALPSNGAMSDLDYEGIVGVFMTPDTDTPRELANALYFIHEMATPEGMDDLIDESGTNGISLDGNPDPTAADVAVQVWLQDSDLLERKHAEQYLTRPRSFEYFQTEASPAPKLKTPSKKTLAALEKSLDDWFVTKKRGRGTRVFVFPKNDSVWFLVRHGQPYERKGVIEDGESSSLFFRGEAHDVLVYEQSLGELRMNACSKGEKETYRTKFGLHLFGDEDFFPGTGKYTLEPLRTAGAKSLACTDVDGIEWIKLKQIEFFWGGSEKEIEVRKANDVFAALEARERKLPAKARIIRASFLMKFKDAKTPRTVTVRPSNITQYTRDDDSGIAEEWLRKRGFILADE